YALTGLRVEPVDVPTELPESGIIEDTANDRTVFTAVSDGNTFAFAISGVGGDRTITAALARELICGLAAKKTDDPVRDFLEGTVAQPPVTVGRFDYYVFAAYCAGAKSNVREYLTAMAGADDFVADMGGGITAFCKKTDDDDYRSAGEFAVVLRENLAEEIDSNIKIGVGGIAHGVSELPTYYMYAKSALTSGAEFDPRSDVYSYKEYALIKILSELPRHTTEKFVKTALDRSYRAVLSDNELMTAADAFIRHSLNISEASRSMYVHRNTLIYRLDKIEKLTGLNIRNFNDAMTFRVAYLIYKLLSDEPEKA
ncbi:MAG: helix-turn-helix domain-containing protein, partial [Clostridiales bacterium]|nr:helix-turn-helix domain-containing protein [Clostridiales bacterium]